MVALIMLPDSIFVAEILTKKIDSGACQLHAQASCLTQPTPCPLHLHVE